MSQTQKIVENSCLLLGIGISTLGRPAILQQILADISKQTRLPDRITVCHVSASDIDGIDGAAIAGCADTRFITAAIGLPRQRNAILDDMADVDVLLFLDDDFLMAPHYIEAVIAAFQENPEIVATTGTLIHDGVKGPGLTPDEGRALIARHEGATPRHTWHAAPHGYGCNMAIRIRTARDHALRFDERLPLYGWSEDIDYTHRIARYGTIAKLHGACGVHLGAKQGRSSGRRLGYSQVANPIYLLHKGSYSFGRAGRSVARNLAANCLRAFWPEPYIDRRGRLAGNIMAVADMCRGRMRPERMLEL